MCSVLHSIALRLAQRSRHPDRHFPSTKVKSKAAVSTKRVGSTFIDVTGNAYQDVSTFVPQFDEVGVLPPLGRWDPLQIREQGPERYRRFVEMEIKHGRLAMAGF